jgi:hypothetical protein
VIPRDYQRAAVAAPARRPAAHGNTLLLLPTASGKTAIAGFYIAEEASHDPTSRFLVLQHTDELIEQNQATIGRITTLPGSIVKAERDDWSGRVVFGSVQTLARSNRRARITPVGNLVIDESTAPQPIVIRPSSAMRAHFGTASSSSASAPRPSAATDAACAGPSATSVTRCRLPT